MVFREESLALRIAESRIREARALRTVAAAGGLPAIDATGGNGAIHIRTATAAGGRVELVIEDSGCGIPHELQHRLFEPFFTTKPVGRGVGIGLSTCYAIVKSHNGEISVTSAAGQGSAFRVALPGVHA